MKNKTILTILVGAALFVPFTLVQAEKHDKGDREYSLSDKKMKKLNLNDEQKTKLKAVFDAQRTAAKPLYEKGRELHKKLEEQLKAKASDAEIQVTLHDLQANKKAVYEQMESFRSQKAAILTPTQQAQMLLRRGEMLDSRHGRGKQKS